MPGAAPVMPALNDAHVHFMMGSRSLADLDLAGADTQATVERRIRDFVATFPEREWVVGRRWWYLAFPGGMPGIEALDRLVPDRPACLESYDAHTAWVNSRALAIAGLKATDAGGTRAAAGVSLADSAARSDAALTSIIAMWETMGDRPFNWYIAETTGEAILRNSYLHPRIHIADQLLERGEAARSQRLTEETVSELRAVDAPARILGAALYTLAAVQARRLRSDEATRPARGKFHDAR